MYLSGIAESGWANIIIAGLNEKVYGFTVTFNSHISQIPCISFSKVFAKNLNIFLIQGCDLGGTKCYTWEYPGCPKSSEISVIKIYLLC